MAPYFTGNEHVHHIRIPGIARLPSQDVREHDQTSTCARNEVVTPAEKVWHVGDFAVGAPARMERAFHRLNGAKDLIGYHDGETVQTLPSVSVSTIAETLMDGRSVRLRHRPMRTGPSARRDAVHLYGPMHGLLRGTSLSLDMGVDCWTFRLVTQTGIVRRRPTPPPDPDFAGLTGAR